LNRCQPVFTGSTIVGPFLSRQHTAESVNDIAIIPIDDVAVEDCVSATSIPLRAKADADVRDVYWFAGKTFLGKCSAAEVLAWKSAPGDYELTVLDDHGRAGSGKVIVR
jgi:membrane carboxypeptidase/penicillin-binding protein PbpC